MSFELVIPILAAAVQSGTPILFAVLGEMITEKSGVLNLGVEGMMLIGALTGFVATLITGSPWIGFVAAGCAGAVAASLHAVVCLVFLGNQVVSGLALTILGTGLADFFGAGFVGRVINGFPRLSVPYLSDIPIFGRIFFDHDILVYFSFCLPVLFWFFLERTSAGRAVKAVGENPSAAAAVGLNPVRIRFWATLAGGFFAGLGGAYLSLAYTHLWNNGMTAGRGWIAVALVIFAFWRPGRAVFGAYLFGGVMAFQLRLQAAGTELPSSILLMLPYALTVLVLIRASMHGKNTAAPAGLAENIEPEE